MPFVNLKLVGKLTKDQKQKVVDEFSSTLERVCGKKKEGTYIVIEEYSAENWGADGKLLS